MVSQSHSGRFHIVTPTLQIIYLFDNFSIYKYGSSISLVSDCIKCIFLIDLIVSPSQPFNPHSHTLDFCMCLNCKPLLFSVYSIVSLTPQSFYYFELNNNYLIPVDPKNIFFFHIRDGLFFPSNWKKWPVSNLV